MSDCIFCKIVSGEIPAKKVFEDDELLAFDDVNPVAPVHVLVIPKQHIPTLNDVAPEHSELLGRMLSCARTLARQAGLTESGYRIVMNCMAGAGQSVFHLHAHVLGGRTLRWPPG